jgi:hypothetical protein
MKTPKTLSGILSLVAATFGSLTYLVIELAPHVRW